MALAFGMYSLVATIPADPSGLSAGVALGAGELVGIGMPAVWTSADLSFLASIDDATWLELQSGTAAVTLKADANQFVQVDPALWRGVRALKIRSGLVGLPVQQGAIRALTLMLRAHSA